MRPFRRSLLCSRTRTKAFGVTLLGPWELLAPRPRLLSLTLRGWSRTKTRVTEIGWVLATHSGRSAPQPRLPSLPLPKCSKTGIRRFARRRRNPWEKSAPLRSPPSPPSPTAQGQENADVRKAAAEALEKIKKEKK